jgi:hypothetical protein
MRSSHPRNTQGMRASPRCGARTRKGTPCTAPAVFGKARCRMHGGASGSGAPKGYRNALKTGAHTAEMKAFREELREIVQETRELLKTFEVS